LNPYFDPTKPHHTASVFRNNYVKSVERSFTELLRWQRERRSAGLPKPSPPTPVQSVDLAFIDANAKAGAGMQPAFTWIGHSSTLAQACGLNVLTDPVFSQRASPFSFLGPKRAQPAAIALKHLPAIDVVVISHNHYDHLDRASVLALAAQESGSPLFLVPLGIGPWMKKLGIREVVELDWWQSHPVNGVDFHFTPTQHWSGRGLGDRSQTLWGAWAALGPNFQWYFSGDTAYSPDFLDTASYFAAKQTPEAGGGFDAALIAIGAYEPRWFMREQHVDPREAVRIHGDLGAKKSIGVHWGTFSLTDEPLDAPPRDLTRALADARLAPDEFMTLAIGETMRFATRQAQV
jgi:N-acyl-phosphatidylethanolamine-hydrolysing phospholipase D